MRIPDIDQLNLHDSDVLRMESRIAEAGGGVVSLYLDYITTYEPIRTCPKVLRFVDCCYFRAESHMQVIGLESISSAEAVPDSEVVAEASKHLPNGSDGFRHYVVNLNLTGARYDIVCRSLELIDP